MNLLALRQAERQSGMRKIAESSRTDINTGVQAVMSKIAYIIVQKIRATKFQSPYYLLYNAYSTASAV
jgi:hypothetical protein